MASLLKQSFFDRTALQIAPELLGKVLVRAAGSRRIAQCITEVEAYNGACDKACHAHKGRTKRTEVMFGPPGHWYVYLCYGVHEMLNIVTGPGETPSAVLIRGLAEVNGPGRLTKELGITREFNTLAARKQTGLWIEDRGVVVPRRRIERTPRIGINYAEEYTEKPWRFLLRE